MRTSDIQQSDDPTALRILALLTRRAATRTRRRQDRVAFKERRDAGLQARHERKLARTGDG